MLTGRKKGPLSRKLPHGTVEALKGELSGETGASFITLWDLARKYRIDDAQLLRKFAEFHGIVGHKKSEFSTAEEVDLYSKRYEHEIDMEELNEEYQTSHGGTEDQDIIRWKDLDVIPWRWVDGSARVYGQAIFTPCGAFSFRSGRAWPTDEYAALRSNAVIYGSRSFRCFLSIPKAPLFELWAFNNSAEKMLSVAPTDGDMLKIRRAHLDLDWHWDLFIGDETEITSSGKCSGDDPMRPHLSVGTWRRAKISPIVPQ